MNSTSSSELEPRYLCPTLKLPKFSLVDRASRQLPFIEERSPQPTEEMPSYHSKLVSDKSVGNVALLPFRTKFRGPIQSYSSANGNEAEAAMDIVDEALFYFKPNVFFKTYEIQSNADRVLIYLTLYIIECLKRLQRLNSKEGAYQEMHALAISRFDIPGDPGFPLNAVYAKPNNAEEQDLLRQYFLQIRQECGVRLVERVFDTENQKPSKWWLCFAKRKFMDISLSGAGK